MGRGGIGARKALAERVQRASQYPLTGVRTGSRIAECLDRYGRWELGHRTGTLIKLISQTVWVKWDDEEDIVDYRQADARYKVDRGM